LLPDVHFGQPGVVRDWRKDLKDAEPDDDELLAQTPPDVKALLGFDPLEMETEE